MWGPAAVCAGGRRPAREIATREPEGSEWSISRPALALPPPTGTAARPSGPFGTLHTSGAWSLIGASARCPCQAPPPPTGTAARPRAPAAEPTPNFTCNSVATLKPTAPLLTAHHFRPFRARFSLAEAMSVSSSRPHPLAKVPPVSPRCRKVRALALPLSQQDTSSHLSERNTAPALHENALSQAA